MLLHHPLIFLSFFLPTVVRAVIPSFPPGHILSDRYRIIQQLPPPFQTMFSATSTYTTGTNITDMEPVTLYCIDRTVGASGLFTHGKLSTIPEIANSVEVLYLPGNVECAVTRFRIENSLDDWIRRNGKLNRWQAKSLVRQALQAMVRAHVAGITFSHFKMFDILVLNVKADSVRVQFVDYGLNQRIDTGLYEPQYIRACKSMDLDHFRMLCFEVFSRSWAEERKFLENLRVVTVEQFGRMLLEDEWLNYGNNDSGWKTEEL